MQLVSDGMVVEVSNSQMSDSQIISYIQYIERIRAILGGEVFSTLLMLLACSGDKITDTSADTTTDDTSVTDTEDTDTDNQETVTTDSEYVDQDCVDGQYSEVVPTPNTDIDSIKDTYSSNNVEGFISDVLGQRFTVGQYIFQQGVQAIEFFQTLASIISWGIHRVQVR